MYHQASWFVDREDLLIFEQNLKSSGFGKDPVVLWGPAFHPDHFPRAHAV
jgi:hypothetical protein